MSEIPDDVDFIIRPACDGLTMSYLAKAVFEGRLENTPATTSDESRYRIVLMVEPGEGVSDEVAAQELVSFFRSIGVDADTQPNYVSDIEARYLNEDDFGL